MRFLADMGVSQSVVHWLRSNGHDAIHLREQGLQRLPNGEIFQKAASEDRVVLTFDLDFGEILAGSGGKKVSVILFRLQNARSGNVVGHLQKVLQQYSVALEAGAIIVVQEGRHRVRLLPIGKEPDSE
jgi:predicted nuclease of predicted toxin-antitoxin system